MFRWEESLNSTLKIRLGISLALLAVAALGTLRFINETAVKTRFLTRNADTIVNDAELMRYAMPRGEEAYQTHCASCHGANLSGDPKRGVPNLKDRDWLYGSGQISEIERIVRYGIRAGISRTQNLASMPAFANASPYPRYKMDPLTHQEVQDVAALIYSFQHPAAVERATWSRGNDIYHGKGYCFDCHSGDARGDPAIGAPNLTDNTWLYGDGSLDSIRFSIENGLSGYCPGFASRLAAEDMRAVAVYVHQAERT